MSNNDQIDPSEFLRGIREKDANVIGPIIDQMLPMINAYVCKNNGINQDAEDLIAEAMVAVFLKAQNPDFSFDCAVSTYLYAVCRNLWLKQLRKDKGHKRELEEHLDIPSKDDSLLELLEETEKKQLYLEKLQLLTKREQHLLFLFYTEKKSYEEIADILELNSIGYTKKLKFLA